MSGAECFANLVRSNLVNAMTSDLRLSTSVDIISSRSSQYNVTLAQSWHFQHFQQSEIAYISTNINNLSDS